MLLYNENFFSLCFKLLEKQYSDDMFLTCYTLTVFMFFLFFCYILCLTLNSKQKSKLHVNADNTEFKVSKCLYKRMLVTYIPFCLNSTWIHTSMSFCIFLFVLAPSSFPFCDVIYQEIKSFTN